jgi:hypothetical protein
MHANTIPLHMSTYRKVGVFVLLPMLCLPWLVCTIAPLFTENGLPIAAISGVLLTCTIALPIWMWRRWPRSVDAEGLTMRSGRRHLWKDLRDLRRVRTLSRYGRRMTSWRLELVFATGKAELDSITFDNARDVGYFLERVLQRELVPR